MTCSTATRITPPKHATSTRFCKNTRPASARWSRSDAVPAPMPRSRHRSATRLPAVHAERIEFSHGDARSVRLGRRFGAVVSLFHVMSYQTSNTDLTAAFATAAAHLEPGGVFVFDCWYGPAVLTERPSTVVKKLSDEAIDVKRVAEPQMHAEENVVDVNYAVTITDRITGKVETLHETHRMRYLFTPEIAMMLEGAGMALVESREWMTDRAPGFHTWSACFVGRSSQS